MILSNSLIDFTSNALLISFLLFHLLYSSGFFGYVIFIGDNGICVIKKGGKNTFLKICLVVEAVV